MTNDNLRYVFHHVFMPPKLPQEDDLDDDLEEWLCKLVTSSAEEYVRSILPEQQVHFRRIVKMLKNTHQCQSQDNIVDVMADMRCGDVFPLLIRAQNAGLIIRKGEDATTFESFEVSPDPQYVMAAEGRLLCSYPGPAISVPNATVDDLFFRSELANFLFHMSVDVLDSAPRTTKAKSEVVEERGTASPRYITQLLTEILRGMGQGVDVVRIQKRINDDVLWESAFKPWRRSSMWLLIRVALQTTLFCGTGSHVAYKAFTTYFMSRILRTSVENNLPSDWLHVMKVKLSRRLSKLGAASPSFVTQTTYDTVNAAHTLMQARWLQAQTEQQSSSPWVPERLDIFGDTNLSLINSAKYLSWVLSNQSPTPALTPFNPREFQRYLTIAVFDLSANQLGSSFKANGRVALADFERAVQHHLDDWVTQNLSRTSGCSAMQTCITQYYAAASKAYSSHPEETSLMLLTIFDLWVALDKLAVARHSLLQQYSPEVRLGLLEPLLLRKSKSLERLSRIEKYLRQRHRDCAGLSVFCDPGSDSFAVRFFKQSTYHQNLKLRIERDATCQRKNKLQELQVLNDRYERLCRQARSLNHNYGVNRRGDRYHTHWCSKCSLEREAQMLRIEVHEWPLPDGEFDAQSAVFELSVPIDFQIWRTTTFQILHDICSIDAQQTVTPHVRVCDYSGLKQYNDEPSSRITLASDTKSFVQAHYSNPRIPSDEASVCLNNGLHLRLFDTLSSEWAARHFTSCSLNNYCVLQLPATGAYQGLQYAVNQTSHTMNEVLANQADCRRDLTLHEYIAFGALRSGPLLQWLNIARTISDRSLTFNKVEVHTLILQSIWQVGLLSSADPDDIEWHTELCLTEFGRVLLAQLDDLLDSVRENWLEGNTLRSIIAIISRLLVSAQDNDILLDAYTLMRKSRTVTFEWTRQLVQKLQSSEGDDLIHQFQQRVCEMAATCRGTYDVDPCHLPHLLKTDNDLAILVECAILVCYNSSPHSTNLPHDFQALLHRDGRLSHAIEPLLMQHQTWFQDGMNQAVKTIWTSYRPGSVWERLGAPNDRWATTRTASQHGQKSQTVHFDILKGTLLVDGKPLGRLPNDVVIHPNYIRIFGQKVLDVIPADISGMDFMTRDSIGGYQVYFGFRDDPKTLVIRAQAGTTVFELVPHNKFRDDLPDSFVTNFTHWLNLASCDVEFRPLDKPWVSSETDWHLQFHSGHIPNAHQSSRMCRTADDNSSHCLLDVRSSTVQMIYGRLKALDAEKHIVVTLNCNNKHLKAELPRLRLSFFLNDEGQLESVNIRGMVVDSNQSPGTFIGLLNQLVLREKKVTANNSRRIIIPNGKVIIQSRGHHVQVMLEAQNQAHNRYHEYEIDILLGRLVGNVSLASRLYKIYLHAITSHCLPDPLTGRTGTQEALHDLCSAGSLSFQTLQADELDTLRLLSSLTPSRNFYPKGKQVMQTVVWSNNLSFLAQHDRFLPAVQSIAQHAKRLAVFDIVPSPEASVIHAITSSTSSEHLLKRAAGRNVLVHPNEYGEASPCQDTTYLSRDGPASGEPGGSPAFKTSATVNTWPSRLSTLPTQLRTTLMHWKKLETAEFSLSYNRKWLDPDLKSIWLTLYKLCRHSSSARQRQFQLAFSLSALAYNSVESRDLIPALIAFATIPQFRTLDPPPWPTYDLTKGLEPSTGELLKIVLAHAVTFEDSDDANVKVQYGESEADARRRCYNIFDRDQRSDAMRLVHLLVQQWPCEIPRWPSSHFKCLSFSNQQGLTVVLWDMFKTWHRNSDFISHIEKVQAILDKVRCADAALSRPYSFMPCTTSHSLAFKQVSYSELFRTTCAPVIDVPPEIHSPIHLKIHGSPDTSELGSLLTEFRTHPNQLHRRYGTDLDESRQSLATDRFARTDTLYPIDVFVAHRDACSRHYNQVLVSIGQVLQPTPLDQANPTQLNQVKQTVLFAGQWPCLTPRALLRHLTFHNRSILPVLWKRALKSLAQALLHFQHSRRLVTLANDGNYGGLSRELNQQHSDAIADDYHLDWLLIQVEGNFIARPIQLQVAYEMMTPRSQRNTALQLNMGEGKSSVIVPMVAAALANGHELLRVVVLKSLATQMFHLLIGRLSGLANRRLYYLPFSRNSELTIQKVQVIRKLYEECAHVGIDRLLSAASTTERQVANGLVESQSWLNMHSRDILDESDEILHVRYQLIYTVGTQQSLEGHPDRWTMTQEVLSLVKNNLHHIQTHFPNDIEVEKCRPECYPQVRILRAQAGVTLVEMIIKDVFTPGRFATQPFGLLSAHISHAARNFVTTVEVADEEYQLLSDFCKDTGFWNGLLLLRGLFAYGILMYVLAERRWRVDYGLDPIRTLLAVPYRAKDVPSLRAEFGHPDVAILLTSLSYLYGGLSEDQLDLCFELLYKTDNPSAEYEVWARIDHTIPKALRELSGINISDPEQKAQFLVPRFCRNHAVINFYLSQVVFPKEAKEFPEKLATSGWDLAKVKEHITTGFSGTNDGRYLLPTSMIQDDPVGQLSTNAKVLGYLLQPENNHYYCIHQNDTAASAHVLNLITRTDPQIRVLLDVGAQMLDLQNHALARRWLELRPEIPAAIFFRDDEPVVLTQDGNVEPFITSPFNQQLDQCLLYLDDVHTRGSDFKLPKDFRAAVTLGPRVTKDRLLQGCMRMRQLGNGQSVAFFVPPEVDFGIKNARQAAGKGTTANITVIDIIRWLLLQTCEEIERYIPQWAQQGYEFETRQNSLERYTHSSNTSQLLRSAWLQPEAQTLESMYGKPEDGTTTQHPAFGVPEIKERCQELGFSVLKGSQMAEEQEREVKHEIERERQIERPPKATPAIPTLHPHVLALVRTGRIPTGSSQFVSPFHILLETAHAKSLWSKKLLATHDFSTTIIRRGNGSTGDYLGPVNWVLSSAQDGSLVILSHHEANALLPHIRQSTQVNLHQYSPRVTQAMHSFEDLKFYCIPPLPQSWTPPSTEVSNQLNLWAGHLYLRDYETALQVCNFLGLYSESCGPVDDVEKQVDGFIKPVHRRTLPVSQSPFTTSPIPFFKRLMGLRRKGMGYSTTHLGKLLHARSLTCKDFE